MPGSGPLMVGLGPSPLFEHARIGDASRVELNEEVVMSLSHNDGESPTVACVVEACAVKDVLTVKRVFGDATSSTVSP